MLDIYKTFYKLRDEPFRLSPDYEFCFVHRSYANARAYLRYAVSLSEGCIAITGAPGMGKTTLVRELLSELDDGSCRGAMLTGIQLDPDNFLRMVLGAFDLPVAGGLEASPLAQLEQFLGEQTLSGRQAVLIIDEAQGLSAGSLEELRLLSNMQRDNRLLLQVFLVGQQQLLETIQAPGMEHLRQRLVAACRLEPLDFDETVSYVEHRLCHVGWNGVPAISKGALREIHRFSGGVPRSINLICTRLLVLGGLESKRELNEGDAREVIEELHQEGLGNVAFHADAAASSDDDERRATRRKAESDKNIGEISNPNARLSRDAEESADLDPIERRSRRAMVDRRWGWGWVLALGLAALLGLTASLNTDIDDHVADFARAFFFRVAADMSGSGPNDDGYRSAAVGKPPAAASGNPGRAQARDHIVSDSMKTSADGVTDHTAAGENEQQAAIDAETSIETTLFESTLAIDPSGEESPTSQVTLQPEQEPDKPAGSGRQSQVHFVLTEPQTKRRVAKNVGVEEVDPVSSQAAIETERIRLRKDAERRFAGRMLQATASAKQSPEEVTTDVSVIDESRGTEFTSPARQESSGDRRGKNQSVPMATSGVASHSKTTPPIPVEEEGKPIQSELAPTRVGEGSNGKAATSMSQSDRIISFLLANNWHSGKGAAMLLPSELTYCRRYAEDVKCWSVPRSTDSGSAIYKVEGRLQDFSKEGDFRVVFRMLVKRLHGETPLATEDTQKDSVWKVTEHSMGCRVIKPSRVQCRDERDASRDYWLAGAIEEY